MSSARLVAYAFLWLVACAFANANAEVTDAASNGFSIRHSIEIDARRGRVYEAVIRDVGQWWSDDHTMSGAAANMYIEATAPGCFCEALPNSGRVVHMMISFVNPGVMLRMTGGLGPLGLMGVNGNMTWEFEDSGDGSTLTLRYAVGGYRDGGLDAIAAAVDQVLLEQLQSLKAHVESAARD